jgi:hypothetical protein
MNASDWLSIASVLLACCCLWMSAAPVKTKHKKPTGPPPRDVVEPWNVKAEVSTAGIAWCRGVCGLWLWVADRGGRSRDAIGMWLKTPGDSRFVHSERSGDWPVAGEWVKGCGLTLEDARRGGVPI